MRAFLKILIAILFVSCVYILFFWQPMSTSEDRAATLEPQGGDFTLQSLSGPVSLADFRGKVVMIYFGYTMCPDICPTNLAIMADALRQLDQEALQKGATPPVQGIFISVDPQRDTLVRLSDYTGYFHQSIIGLSATEEQVKEVAQRYGVAYQRATDDSASQYAVDHSSETYIVDARGQLVQRLPHATPPDKLITTIKQYSLKQP